MAVLMARLADLTALANQLAIERSGAEHVERERAA